MYIKLISLILLFTGVIFTPIAASQQYNQTTAKPENTLAGKWVRIGQTGPIAFEFKENGWVEADFGNDQTVDVISGYEISGDTIKFIDKEGQMCE